MKVLQKDVWAVIIILSFSLLHVPFLFSDPDINCEMGRGPWTDEGLFSLQIRNLLNNGSFSFSESEGFLKAPLLNALLFIPFVVFGTTLLTARITILAAICVILFFQFRLHRNLLLLGMFLGMFSCNIHLFHFSHFALSDIICCLCIVSSFISLYQYLQSGSPFLFRNSLWWLNTCWLFKIQYLYLLIVPVLILFLRRRRTKSFRTELFQFTSITGISVVSFLLLIVLPDIDTAEKILLLQFTDKHHIESIRQLGLIVENNWHHRIAYNKWLLLVYSVVVIALWVNAFLKKNDSVRSIHLVLLLTFIFLMPECSKLALTYNPFRYFLSIYTVLIFVLCFIVSNSIQAEKIRYLWLIIATVFISVFVPRYSEWLHSRKYTLNELNKKYAHILPQQSLVIGTWASALNWESKCRSIPVWNGYFVPALQSGQYIVSEKDEAESEQAFLSAGIILDSMAVELSRDSIKSYELVLWKVK